MKKNKMYLKIPTRVVRNDGYKLTNGEFVVYTYIFYYYFKNPNKDKENILLDHKILMLNCKITDTRTLKKRLKALYENNLILDEISKFPNKKGLLIRFNSSIYEQEKAQHFTLINASILTYFNNNQIDEYALRQIFYYKSQINKRANKLYSYVSYETLCKDLNISKDKITTANKQLEKHKLIRVEKHVIQHNEQYDEMDALIYTKYNNHYYINDSLC